MDQNKSQKAVDDYGFDIEVAIQKVFEDEGFYITEAIRKVFSDHDVLLKSGI